MLFDKKYYSKIDVVIIICDARCPNISSNKNTILEHFIKTKKIVQIAWKSDLISNKTKNKLMKQEEIYFFSRKNKNLKEKIIKIIKEYNKKNNFLNLLVVGFENVGKSSFINTLLKRKRQKTENKNGVTKKISVPFTINNKYYFVDTPGIKAKFDNDIQKKILQLCNLLPTKKSEMMQLIYFALQRISAFKNQNLLIRKDLLLLMNSNNIEIFEENLNKYCQKKFTSNNIENIKEKAILEIYNWLIYKSNLKIYWE